MGGVEEDGAWQTNEETDGRDEGRDGGCGKLDGTSVCPLVLDG